MIVYSSVNDLANRRSIQHQRGIEDLLLCESTFFTGIVCVYPIKIEIKFSLHNKSL